MTEREKLAFIKIVVYIKFAIRETLVYFLRKKVQTLQ